MCKFASLFIQPFIFYSKKKKNWTCCENAHMKWIMFLAKPAEKKGQTVPRARIIYSILCHVCVCVVMSHRHKWSWQIIFFTKPSVKKFHVKKYLNIYNKFNIFSYLWFERRYWHLLDIVIISILILIFMVTTPTSLKKFICLRTKKRHWQFPI